MLKYNLQLPEHFFVIFNYICKSANPDSKNTYARHPQMGDPETIILECKSAKILAIGLTKKINKYGF